METFERDRARLLALLTQHSYARRKVTLASGRESDFYVDCKQTDLRAEGHVLVGRLLHARILEVTPDAVAVGGLTLGADPIASAVSTMSFLAGRPLDAFLVRKEPKGHGTGRWIEHPGLPAGARVAIVEDVVTTGGSGLLACERVEAEGFVVAGVFALVDRLEGGRDAFESRGYALHPLFTRADFPGAGG